MSKIKATTNGLKIGIVRYLQLKPQQEIVKNLLLKTFPKEFKTIEEWDEQIKNILGKKITT